MAKEELQETNEKVRNRSSETASVRASVFAGGDGTGSDRRKKEDEQSLEQNKTQLNTNMKKQAESENKSEGVYTDRE